MKNERILIADDNTNIRNSLTDVIEFFGEEDGHKIVGEAASKEEVEALLNGGLRPTVAFVDGNFPNTGDGEKAAEMIRKISPKTFIISFSLDRQKWGDQSWDKNMSGKDIVEKLTKLEH
jgi:DNA-binding NarL/FixJ family response regulator